MKNVVYKSVPLVASVIRGTSGKSLYLTHVTSLDGSRIYSDGWCPIRWGKPTEYLWRYTNKDLNIVNSLVTPGRYYRFHFKDNVLMTPRGAVTHDGAQLKVPGLVKHKIAGNRQIIGYEFHSQSLVEFPMTKVTPAMDINRWKGNKSLIKSKLVDTKVQEYLQITDRYIINVPVFCMDNFKERRLTPVTSVDNLFSNDDNPESIIEQTAYDSHVADKFNYIDRSEMYQDVRPDSSNSQRTAMQQWLIDNPEYDNQQY